MGVVFVGRRIGESADAHAGAYSDGTPHMLALTAAERAAVDFCQGPLRRRVVVVLESSAPMQIAALEDDGGVNAILWVGGAGSGGYESLGDILAGKVVPSGRLPDCYPSDFTRDPTFANFDDGSDRFVYANAYTTLVGNYDVRGRTPTPPSTSMRRASTWATGTTRRRTTWAFCKTTTTGRMASYTPLRYGLSYTSFSQRILSFSQSGGSIAVTVRVTNTGRRYAGRTWCSSTAPRPTPSFDRDYDIEKPTAVLLQFERPDPSLPGSTRTWRLPSPGRRWPLLLHPQKRRRHRRVLRSGGGGLYSLRAQRLPHRAGPADRPCSGHRHGTTTTIPVRRRSAPSPLWIRTAACSATRPRAARPIRRPSTGFRLLSAYMADPAVSSVTVLSRKDWAGTQPTAPTDQTGTPRTQWCSGLRRTTPPITTTPQTAAWATIRAVWSTGREAALTGEENGMVLADLRGKSYYDPMWDLLLNQLTFSDAEEAAPLSFEDAYHTGP